MIASLPVATCGAHATSTSLPGAGSAASTAASLVRIGPSASYADQNTFASSADGPDPQAVRVMRTAMARRRVIGRASYPCNALAASAAASRRAAFHGRRKPLVLAMIADAQAPTDWVLTTAATAAQCSGVDSTRAPGPT
jgi:hypothetical protein